MASSPQPKLLRVSIESPYAAPTPEEIGRNIRYAWDCVRHSIMQGESPYASHLFYTHILQDADPVQRVAGLAMSHEWRKAAELIAFYVDFGMSSGMQDAEALAKAHDIPTEYRLLYQS